MNRKEYGIFTPYSINLYGDCNEDKPVNFLKRNAILFEKLVIVPTGIGPLDGTGLFTKESYLQVVSKEEIKNVKEFNDMFLTIDDFVPEERSVEFYRPSNDETSMWMGESSAKYIDFVTKFVQKKLNLPTTEIQSKEHYEELKYYIGTISADFQILTEVMKAFDTFSGMFTEIHEDAYQYTYTQFHKKIQSKPVLSAVESINHFDFGLLTWDQIIQLRKSGFVNDFRNKIHEWTNEFQDIGSSIAFQKKLDRFINDAKFEFIEAHKPNMTKSILTGIAGNIPLPIPLNPVSIASSINQMEKDQEIKEKFGWLFFIQKARKTE